MKIVKKKSNNTFLRRHLPKSPSKNPDPPVQNNFYTSEDSEEENGEINFPIILNENCEKNQILPF